MSESRTIVGLTGRAQAGKDTAGVLLMKEYGFIGLAFADALRDMMYALNPLVDHTGGRYQTALATLGYEDAKTGLPEFRRLLQVFGTEVMREQFGADVWVDIVGRKIVSTAKGGSDRLPEDIAGSPVVITDCRFPNEAAAIRSWGGTVIRVKRANADGSPFDNGLGTDHPSEQFIDNLPVDYEFTATTVEELEANVRTIANYMLTGNPYVAQT